MMALDRIKKELGITEDMIVEVNGTESAMELGYNVIVKDIKTNNKLQVIEIYPLVQFSDGMPRPVNCGWDVCKYNMNIYLNKRIQV